MNLIIFIGLYGGFSDGQRPSPRTLGLAPSSLSSYSTLKPEMVEEADVQDTTKLFEVISVTDSEVSTTRAGWVVSPSDVSTLKIQKRYKNVLVNTFTFTFAARRRETTLRRKSTHESRGWW